MAGLLSMKVFGVAKMTRGIKSTQRGLKNMRAVNMRAAVVYDQWIKKNFRDQGRNHENSSLRWKPLAESTLDGRRKGKKKDPSKILRDTDNLMMRWQITADNKKAVVQSLVNYSSFHEKGVRGRLPRRKIFPTDVQGRKIVNPVYKQYMDKITKW